MAKVFLSSGDTFTISNNNVEIVGASGTGTEKVVIQSGVTGTKTDANIERLDIAGNLSGYTFQAVAGTGVVVKDTAGNIIATIPSINQNVTVAFADGSATLVQTGGSAFTLGGQAISTTASAAITSTAMGTGFNTAVTSGSGTSTGSSGAGQAFTLTTGADTPALTLGNDTITGGSNGLLTSSDIILDNSTTDSDVLTAVVNTSTTAPGRIQNVETLNITGEYASTGLSLANVSGAKVLNVNTGMLNGTAAITNASSINATSIVAGANVGTLTVQASSAGTRDTVKIDAGSATSVTLTGDSGADNFDATVKTGATVTLGGATQSTDTYAVHTTGGTLTLAGGTAAAKTVTIDNNTSALALTLTGTAVGTSTGNTFNVTGNGDVTLIVADNDSVSGIALSNSGTGKVGMKITDTAFTANLNKMALNAGVTLSGDSTAANTLKVADSTKVMLVGDATKTTSLTVNADNAAGDLATGGGSVVLEVSQNQTSGTLTTGAKVGTVIMSAKADAASDTLNGAHLTVTAMALDAATTTAVFTGSESLQVTTLTVGAASTIASTGMTGNLTATIAGNFAKTVALGSGNNVITITGTGNDTIQGGAGNDSVKGGDNDDSILGGAGNDTLLGEAGNDVINGGDGNDLITGGAGNDTMTGGAGSDAFVISATDGNDTISDFTVGTDKLILTGAFGTSDFNVASVATPTSGAYTFLSGSVVTTLTGNTATNLTDSIQLGTAAAAFSVTTAKTAVGGAFGDYFTHAANAAITITGGAGADTFYVTNDTWAAAGNDMTVTDFTVGTDMVTLIGTSNDNINLATETGTSGAFQIGGTTGNDYQFTLTGVGDSISAATMVRLGDKDNSFTIGAGSAFAITGGNFADYITSSANDHSITGGLGADVIGLSSGNETLKFAQGDSTSSGWDVVTSFNSGGNDILDFSTLGSNDSTVATGLGGTAVGSITSATVSSGVVTFKDATGTAIASNKLVLTDALGFLSANLVGAKDTVAFEYKRDLNNNGVYSDTGESNSTFVYHNNGSIDDVVELSGVTGITAVAVGLVANTRTHASNTIEIA